MLKRIVVFILLGLFVSFSTQAFALVTTWDYTVSSIFVDSTYDGINYNETLTSLTWGTSTGQGRSSLVIDPSSVTDQVDTYLGGGVPSNAYWADSISLTHNNFPITGTSLLTTTLRTTVTLDPFDPNNLALPDQSFDFDINFAETPNDGNDENDVFALVSGFPDLGFNYDALDGDGLNSYFVNIFPSDGNVLSLLTNPYAALVGVPEGTLGFTTVEGESTTLPFAFTISSEPINPVPEPSTLLLLGGGLIGFGFFARRRKK